jgi:hypothetical protein
VFNVGYIVYYLDQVTVMKRTRKDNERFVDMCVIRYVEIHGADTNPSGFTIPVSSDWPQEMQGKTFDQFTDQQIKGILQKHNITPTISHQLISTPTVQSTSILTNTTVNSSSSSTIGRTYYPRSAKSVSIVQKLIDANEIRDKSVRRSIIQMTNKQISDQETMNNKQIVGNKRSRIDRTSSEDSDEEIKEFVRFSSDDSDEESEEFVSLVPITNTDIGKSSDMGCTISSSSSSTGRTFYSRKAKAVRITQQIAAHKRRK